MADKLTKSEIHDTFKTCIAMDMDAAARAAPDDLFMAVMDCEARVQDTLEAKARHHIKSLNPEGDLDRFKSLMTAFCVRIAASVVDSTLSWADGAYWVTRYATMLPPHRADLAEAILEDMLKNSDAEVLRMASARKEAEGEAIRLLATTLFELNVPNAEVKSKAMRIAKTLDEPSVRSILREQYNTYTSGKNHAATLRAETAA